MAQFFLLPLPIVLAALAYGAWRWAHADYGVLETSNSHGYHVLGWTVLPLTLVAGALFAGCIGRGVRGRRTAALLAATLAVVVGIFVLVFWRSAALDACACTGG